jgi:septal ring factor EnvC (AmiA/AmiB activator)
MNVRQRRNWFGGAKASCAGALLIAQLSHVTAQDVRGLEVCTTEKQMERRTSCLQANVDFLHQALTKLTRETQDRIASVSRDLTDARAEIIQLKSTIAKLKKELEQLEAGGKK